MRLIVVASALLFPGVLSGQLITCSLNAENVPVRGEGFAELVGDLTLQCTSRPGATSAAYLTTDVQVFYNAAVTNTLVSVQGLILSDAILVINENHGPPTATSTLGGAQGNVPLPQLGIPGGNTFIWRQVRLPIPGAVLPGGGRFPDPTTLRLTNVRVNTTSLAGGSAGGVTPVIVQSFSITDGAILPGSLGAPTVGSVLPALQGTVRSTVFSLPQCQASNVNGSVLNGPPAFYVALSERFPNAFLPLGTTSTTPSNPRAVESGYPTGGIGGATQGTRFVLAFNNIPEGVRLGAPVDLSNETLGIRMVASTDSTGIGPLIPIAGAGLQELRVSNGSAQAVYEVVASSPVVQESIEVPVTVGYSSDVERNSPPAGTGFVNISFAPTSGFLFSAASFSSASFNAPQPRFVNDSSAARNVFSVVFCKTGQPYITGLTPSSANSAAGAVNLTLNGAGFTSSSVVKWQGKSMATKFVSATQLTATIPSADLQAVTSSSAQIIVSNPAGIDSPAATFQVIQPVTPTIKTGGIVDAASGQALVAPGGIASIFGSNLSNGTGSYVSTPLPVNLVGATVTVGGALAPLFYASPTQINFQVPHEIRTPSLAIVVVARDNVSSVASNIGVTLFSPAVFMVGTEPAVTHLDGTLVTAGSPAKADEVLIVYATGFGGVTNKPATGAAARSSPLSVATVTPIVTLGGQRVQTLFAGLAPGFVGLAQINIQLPKTLPAGTRLPLIIAINTATSVPVNLAVR